MERRERSQVQEISPQIGGASAPVEILDRCRKRRFGEPAGGETPNRIRILRERSGDARFPILQRVIIGNVQRECWNAGRLAVRMEITGSARRFEDDWSGREYARSERLRLHRRR